MISSFLWISLYHNTKSRTAADCPGFVHVLFRIEELLDTPAHLVGLFHGVCFADIARFHRVDAQTPGKLLACGHHLFDAATRFLRTTGKFLAQDAGVSVGAGASLEDQNFFS